MTDPRPEAAAIRSVQARPAEPRRRAAEQETSLIVYLLQGAAFLVILVGLFALAGFRG